MSRLPSIIRRLASCLVALLLVSCLDSHEEIWINADASGAARIQINLPLAASRLHGGEAGVRKSVEEYLNSTPAFSSYALDVSSADDELRIDLTVTFDNALDLRQATSAEALAKLPAVSPEMVGHTVVEFRGLDLVFSRRLELSKAIPVALFLPKSQLEGHSLTTIIHLPAAATTHNATSTENADRTLVWTTPLATALRKPIETNFTMPLPIPWLTIGFVALLLLLLLAALIHYLRRRKRRTSAT